jgi:hypothetical protein
MTNFFVLVLDIRSNMQALFYKKFNVLFHYL